MNFCYRSTTICLALIAALWLGQTAQATTNVLIDGLHGDLEYDQFCGDVQLDSLYPDVHFTAVGADNLPLYDVLSQGSSIGWDDSIIVDVPRGAPALYARCFSGMHPVVVITHPDQSVTSGSHGCAHVDEPEGGIYVVRITTEWGGGGPYIIGTGPNFLDVCPPSDYDALINLRDPTLAYWNGIPTSYSAADMSQLRRSMNAGGGIGLFYDGAEPIALKPIIRLHDFPQGEATVRLDLPATTTYTKPEPASRQPLIWNVPQAAGDVELDYEARFHYNLNFVWRAPGSNLVCNNSWATARDVKLIEFVRGQGYRISSVGTLAPGAKANVNTGALQSFGAAVRELDGMLRKEALASGMTDEESQTFFDRCHWAQRVLARSCQEPGVVALYRIEGADYDALFPLTTTPAPAETRRVLWVDSYLPDRVGMPCAVHSCLALSPQQAGVQGRYHEYGFFKETYGGDALDDMDQWGWHFYDQMLVDSTNIWDQENGDPRNFYCTEWSNNAIANALSQGVSRVDGCISGGITVQNPADALLVGDADCFSPDGPAFPPGSHPVVIVASAPATGGRIVGTGDVFFLADMEDNLQLGRNIFNWLHRPELEHRPDIELPAEIYQMQPQDVNRITSVYVHNRGNEVLTLTNILPSNAWLTSEGPTTASIAPGDSLAYTFHWNSVRLNAGYYQSVWNLWTNDAGEDTLQRTVAFRVTSPDGTHGSPHAVARTFELSPPFPNPFNLSTTLSFVLPSAGKVKLELCNLLGESVTTLAEGIWATGRHDLRIDLSLRPAGIYFVRGQCAGTVVVRKLVLLK